MECVERDDYLVYDELSNQKRNVIMTNNQPQQGSSTGAGTQNSQALPLVPDGFINVITNTPSTGQMAQTFICSNIDVAGSTNTYYMKVYTSDKQVINEMVGYMLAKARGLNVANKAYLLEVGPITKSLIDNFYNYNVNAKDMTNAGWHNKIKYAFIISEAPGINITSYSSELIKRTNFFKRRIEAWNKNDMLIAFDEWIANTDRNAGNLIFGQNVIYVIDHGSSPVKMDWTLSSLIADQCYNNRHMTNCMNILGKNRRPVDKDLQDESALHLDIINKAKNNLIDLISNTVSMNSEYAHMINFLEQRAISKRKAPFINMSGARS